MKKKIFKAIRITVITLLILTIIASLGVSIYTGTAVASNLVHQNEGKDTREASLYELENWNFDLEGFEEAYTKALMTTTAEDGNTVPFAYIASPKTADNNVVILIHGLGGDYVSTYPQAQMYLEEGWHVIAMDQRASGASDNDMVTFGYFEHLDVKALVDYARTDLKMDTVIVHGISMGGATAGIYGGTEHAADNADAIIMDSAFDSMENVFREVWKSMDTDEIPADYAVGCGDMALRLQYGFNFSDADNAASLKHCQIPVLQIHCLRDTLVSDQMAQSIFDSIGSEVKEMATFDSEHIDAIIDYPVEYKEKTFGFLSQHLN